MNKHSSLCDWLNYLENAPTIPFFQKKKSNLDNITQVARRLNLAQTNAHVITVTGTNGKGSCVEMLTSVYHDAGYVVGTYTSPHLFQFNERIRIQKQSVSDDLLCEAFYFIEQAREGISLTYFEFITLAALWIFKQKNIQIMLLEVGIGGRLDATNLLDADLALITSIGLDHMDYLGNTREAIAKEKSGIFRKNQWVVCGDPFPPKTLIQVAEKLHTKSSYLGKDFNYVVSKDKEKKYWYFNSGENPPCTPLCKGGAILRECCERSKWKHFLDLMAVIPAQMPILAVENAASVLQCVILLQLLLPVDPEKAINAIIQTSLLGRCEIKKMPDNRAVVILDVAHNPQAVSRLATFVQDYKTLHSPQKVTAIFSMLNDKDIQNTINCIKNQIDEWHIAEIHASRAASKEQLQTAFQAHQLSPIWHEDLKNAYHFLKNQLTEKDLLLMFGSFWVVAEIEKFR